MYKNKKILITGGLGFIGSNLAIELVKQKAKVFLLDNFLKDHGANVFNVKPVVRRLQIIKGDIRDQGLVSDLVKDKEIIFNIAAQTSHTQSLKEPLLDLDINCRGNLVLLEACRQFNPEVKIIFVGTRAFYGRPLKVPVAELARIRPVDIYGINRYTAESYHRLYHHLYGLKTVSLRLSNCYGPRGQMKTPNYGVHNWFIRLALENKNIKIFGNGQQKRDYLYIDDLVNLMRQAADQDKLMAGQAFNIGFGQPTSLVNLARQIIKISNSQSKIDFVPWPSINQKIDAGDFITDISKIKKTTGWKPQVRLTQGLRATIDYYRRYKKYYW